MNSDIADNAINAKIYRRNNSIDFTCVIKHSNKTMMAHEFISTDSGEVKLEKSYELENMSLKKEHDSSMIEFNFSSKLENYLFRKYIKEPEYRSIPDPVSALIQFVSKFDLPVVLGPNHSSTEDGCDGASRVRKHLVDAQEYMPIYDELKSIFIRIGTQELCYYTLVHCRGNRELDKRKISRFFREKFNLSGKQSKHLSFISKMDLNHSFGLAKGRVTPFVPNVTKDGVPIIHLFDSDCQMSYGMPMMTNANDPSWATEFDAPSLVKRFCDIDSERYFVYQVVVGPPSKVLESAAKYQNKALGVVEYGLPAASLFRTQLNKEARSILEGMHENLGKGSETIPMVHAGTFSEFSQYSISSPEWEKVMEPDLYDSVIKSKMSDIIGTLKSGGCNMIAIPCNILPYYVNEEENVLSVTEAIQNAISDYSGNGLFLGGRSTRDPMRSIYYGKFNLSDNERLTYLSLSEAGAVDEAMMAVNTDRPEHANKKMFQALATYINGIDFIVVASTSLSVFLKENGSLLSEDHFSPKELATVKEINALPIIDTLSAYAKFCAEKLFE